MSKFIIYTDSSCDLSHEYMGKMNVRFSSLSYNFSAGTNGSDAKLSSKQFYDMLRKGGIAKTSAVNSQEFYDGFEKILKDGYDILYLGVSSALSTTYNSACIAAKALREKYPKRKIVTIDTLAISAGLGLIVDYIYRKKAEGANIDDATSLANGIKDRLCHIFTVDDLNYLKRGGRISPATAAVGSMLGIKPLLHVTRDGRLTSIGKVRGRHAAILALSKKYETNCTDQNEKIFIAHADCPKDADELYRILKEKNPTCDINVTNIGPVIGAHAGPGALALFFVGSK